MSANPDFSEFQAPESIPIEVEGTTFVTCAQCHRSVQKETARFEPRERGYVCSDCQLMRRRAAMMKFWGVVGGCFLAIGGVIAFASRFIRAVSYRPYRPPPDNQPPLELPHR